MITFAQICGGTRTDKTSKHSYDTQYVKYFESMRADVKEVCEIGICRGGSLLLWEEYFPNATLTALDINELDVDGIPSLNHKRDRNDIYIMDEYEK